MSTGDIQIKVDSELAKAILEGLPPQRGAHPAFSQDHYEKIHNEKVVARGAKEELKSPTCGGVFDAVTFVGTGSVPSMAENLEDVDDQLDECLGLGSPAGDPAKSFASIGHTEKAKLLARIKSDFASHKADDTGQTKMAIIRQTCYLAAQVLVGTMPSGRELEEALTALEQVMFHANAGISRPYPIAE